MFWPILTWPHHPTSFIQQVINSNLSHHNQSMATKVSFDLLSSHAVSLQQAVLIPLPSYHPRSSFSSQTLSIIQNLISRSSIHIISIFEKAHNTACFCSACCPSPIFYIKHSTLPASSPPAANRRRKKIEKSRCRILDKDNKSIGKKSHCI